MATKYVLLHESGDLGKAPLHAAEHSSRGQESHDRGDLLMYGPFANAGDGAMAVFTTRESAEEFARDDPFVVNGVVRSWHVREWMEAFSD